MRPTLLLNTYGLEWTIWLQLSKIIKKKNIRIGEKDTYLDNSYQY